MMSESPGDLPIERFTPLPERSLLIEKLVHRVKKGLIEDVIGISEKESSFALQLLIFVVIFNLKTVEIESIIVFIEGNIEDIGSLYIVIEKGSWFWTDIPQQLQSCRTNRTVEFLVYRLIHCLSALYKFNEFSEVILDRLRCNSDSFSSCRFYLLMVDKLLYPIES